MKPTVPESFKSKPKNTPSFRSGFMDQARKMFGRISVIFLLSGCAAPLSQVQTSGQEGQGVNSQDAMKKAQSMVGKTHQCLALGGKTAEEAAGILFKMTTGATAEALGMRLVITKPPEGPLRTTEFTVERETAPGFRVSRFSMADRTLIFETEESVKREEYARLALLTQFMENRVGITKSDLEKDFNLKVESMWGAKPPKQLYKVTWFLKGASDTPMAPVEEPNLVATPPTRRSRDADSTRQVVTVDMPNAMGNGRSKPVVTYQKEVVPEGPKQILDSDGLPVMGDFTREQVNQYIQSRMKMFNFCMPKNEGMTGELILKFAFGKDGKITKLNVRKNTLKNPANAPTDMRGNFKDCAIRAINRLSLPPQSKEAFYELPFDF